MPCALVLSAGGMFGAYQAGAWNVLSRRFQPDLVVGASVGALNGWAIAGGCSPAELLDMGGGRPGGSAQGGGDPGGLSPRRFARHGAGACHWRADAVALPFRPLEWLYRSRRAGPPGAGLVHPLQASRTLFRHGRGGPTATPGARASGADHSGAPHGLLRGAVRVSARPYQWQALRGWRAARRPAHLGRRRNGRHPGHRRERPSRDAFTSPACGGSRGSSPGPQAPWCYRSRRRGDPSPRPPWIGSRRPRLEPGQYAPVDSAGRRRCRRGFGGASFSLSIRAKLGLFLTTALLPPQCLHRIHPRRPPPRPCSAALVGKLQLARRLPMAGGFRQLTGDVDETTGQVEKCARTKPTALVWSILLAGGNVGGESLPLMDACHHCHSVRLLEG